VIIVDDRIGSKEFHRLLTRAGASPCKVKRLRYGDFKIIGQGPNGKCTVGVERKTISEIVSAIGDSRFVGHQLPGLLGNRKDGRRRYDYVFIVVEGDRYIDARSGLLNPQALRHLPRRGHLYRTVQKFELTLMLKAGIRVIYTKNKSHTTEFLAALHEWFSQSWESHKSAYKVEETAPDGALLDRRTMKRKVANQLTGLAWKRTLKADAYFPSIVSMVAGNPTFDPGMLSPRLRKTAIAHWNAALGIKKGTKTAAKIVEVCYARDDVRGKGK
jgi:ERCC4-type nuclease